MVVDRSKNYTKPNANKSPIHLFEKLTQEKNYFVNRFRAGAGQYRTVVKIYLTTFIPAK